MAVSKTLQELAQLVGGVCQGPADLPIRGLAAIHEAGPEEITFVARPRYAKLIATSRAGAFIVSPDLQETPRPLIITANPYLAYAKIAAVFAPPRRRWPGVSNQAVLGRRCQLGADVSISPFVWLGDEVRLGDRVTLLPGVVLGHGVEIGADTTLHANVTVYDRCRLGERVIVHSGTVVGADGFGFAPDGETFTKIPQLGTVVIEDDVEIGANCTIDRGALGETRICRGVKIDNLVMIAHNVVVGENSVIVAQVGISGSTRIGRNVMLAGQVGIVGHIEIGDRARIGAQSGVSNSVPANSVVSGSPVLPQREFLRVSAVQKKLPEMYERLRALEKQVAALRAAVDKEAAE
ncbi:MAG: UDP-3-O-(3-hydroxymyristoyl)glucosamine N-acyltransferase [Desulfobacca sp.]|uniref:UDP-3-O-(3-hydroxymyristoyl)glucosamine N-acyltransferase n=1 Tax=Desulfobacca sp. TaxID=2067990 RepID=UPI0040493C2D